MSSDERKSLEARFSLRRWSARKLEAARQASPAPQMAPPVEHSDAPACPAPVLVPNEAPGAPDLPDVQSLTMESDFSAFLQPEVAEGLKRQALKKLFSDPHFNVMDGLDVYIDDYSVPSPLEPAVVKDLAHAAFTLDPPRTRVNAQGHVEDVSPQEESAPHLAETPPQLAASNATGCLGASAADAARAGERAAAPAHADSPGDAGESR